MAVSFDVSLGERDLITRIAARAVETEKRHRRPKDCRRLVDIEMDITATHANGNPLRLADLLAADDFNFNHDVFGIERHLDRTTGKLVGFFSPRFSRREPNVEAAA